MDKSKVSSQKVFHRYDEKKKMYTWYKTLGYKITVNPKKQNEKYRFFLFYYVYSTYFKIKQDIMGNLEPELNSEGGEGALLDNEKN